MLLDTWVLLPGMIPSGKYLPRTASCPGQTLPQGAPPPVFWESCLEREVLAMGSQRAHLSTFASYLTWATRAQCWEFGSSSDKVPVLRGLTVWWETRTGELPVFTSDLSV